MGTFRLRRALALGRGGEGHALRSTQPRVPPGRSLEQRFPVSSRPRGSCDRLPVRENIHLIRNGCRETRSPNLPQSGRSLRQEAFRLPAPRRQPLTGFRRGPASRMGCLAVRQTRHRGTPNHRLPRTTRTVAMTGSRQADSIASLGNLRKHALWPSGRNPTEVISPTLISPAIFEPDGRQVEETFRNLARKGERQAELPGMDRFLRLRISRRPPRAFPTGESGPYPYPMDLVRTPRNVYPSSSRCNPRRIRNPRTGS